MTFGHMKALDSALFLLIWQPDLFRWNQLDMLIVVLSIAGIVFEEFEALELPINPTIIRVMRVLRIARGTCLNAC